MQPAFYSSPKKFSIPMPAITIKVRKSYRNFDTMRIDEQEISNSIFYRSVSPLRPYLIMSLVCKLLSTSQVYCILKNVNCMCTSDCTRFKPNEQVFYKILVLQKHFFFMKFTSNIFCRTISPSVSTLLCLWSISWNISLVCTCVRLNDNGIHYNA